MSEPLNERSCKHLKKERGWPLAIFTKKGAIIERGDKQAARQALRNRVSEDTALSEKSTTISEFTTAPGKPCRELGSRSLSPDLDQRCADPGNLHPGPGSSFADPLRRIGRINPVPTNT
jgi:hypothetical protein